MHAQKGFSCDSMIVQMRKIVSLRRPSRKFAGLILFLYIRTKVSYDQRAEIWGIFRKCPWQRTCTVLFARCTQGRKNMDDFMISSRILEGMYGAGKRATYGRPQCCRRTWRSMTEASHESTASCRVQLTEEEIAQTEKNEVQHIDVKPLFGPPVEDKHFHRLSLQRVVSRSD